VKTRLSPLVLLLALAISLVACHKSRTASLPDNIIAPGVRCGQFILGETTQREVAATAATKGVDLQFSRDGVLNLVVVTTSDYRTDRNIQVGSGEDDVVHAYGQGKVGNIDLIKSETVIGKVGDKVIFYPGVQFVFMKKQVWAIIVVPKS
jgi:hypothetical protein